MKLTQSEIENLVAIGFCQPKFYKPSVWARAKRLMDTVVCANGLAVPFDYGRGKGKYTTTQCNIDEVKQRTVQLFKDAGTLVEAPDTPDTAAKDQHAGERPHV